MSEESLPAIEAPNNNFENINLTPTQKLISDEESKAAAVAGTASSSEDKTTEKFLSATTSSSMNNRISQVSASSSSTTSAANVLVPLGISSPHNTNMILGPNGGLIGTIAGAGTGTNGSNSGTPGHNPMNSLVSAVDGWTLESVIQPTMDLINYEDTKIKEDVLRIILQYLQDQGVYMYHVTHLIVCTFPSRVLRCNNDNNG